MGVMMVKAHFEDAPWPFIEAETKCPLTTLEKWRAMAKTNDWSLNGFFLRMADGQWVEVRENGRTIH